jgi:hypothetical protein
MPMYAAGGVIAFAGISLTWLGWPWSRPTGGTMPPLVPGHAAQTFVTRPPNKSGGFGRRTRVQGR